MKIDDTTIRDAADDFLDQAFEAARTEPAPQEMRERIIEQAARWRPDSARFPQAKRSIFANPPRGTMLASRRARGRMWIVSAAAVSVAVLLAVWLPRPGVVWAQVAETLRTKPWILSTFTDPDGERVQEWTSIPGGMSASRRGDSAHFSDHRLDVTYYYDSKERTLTRRLAPESNEHAGSDRSFVDLFEQVVRGPEKLTKLAPDIEVTEIKRGPVAKHNRPWMGYELEIRVVEEQAGREPPVCRLTFLVDQKTRLPHYVEFKSPDMNPPSIEMELSYPEKGPNDIYDLGVPRDAKLIDLVPSGDVRRIISEVKASAEHFPAHRALNVMSDPEAPWHVGTPFVVWRDGTRFRVAFGLVNAEGPQLESPKPGADPRQWWKKRWTELFPVPNEICDGSTFWSNTAHPKEWQRHPQKPNPLTWRRSDWPRPEWKSQSRQFVWKASTPPLFIAYPQNLMNYSSFRWEPVLDHEPTDGPANTVKVTLRTGPPDKWTSEERYWIDTRRSHMVVRHDSVTFDINHAEHPETVTLSEIVNDAAESPQGIWYPSVIRHISTYKEGGEDKTVETTTRHYLDFDMKLADDLFKPVERAGEPLD